MSESHAGSTTAFTVADYKSGSEADLVRGLR